MPDIERISRRILNVRGRRVLVDADLAALYGVTTKRLNEQVKRNRARFPAEFVIQLTQDEKSEVVAICDHLANLKFSPVRPFAYTEHGALMASAVLNTPRAIEVSIYVIRAFVQLRDALANGREIGRRLDQLERKTGAHDGAIREILLAIRQLTVLPEAPKRRRIGFVQD